MVDKCNQLEDISRQNNFLLWPIALNDFIQECIQDKKQMEKILSNFPYNLIPQWSQKKYLEILIEKKESLLPQKNAAELYYQLALLKKRRDQKSTLLEKSLKIDSGNKVYLEKLEEVSPRYKKSPKDQELYSIARDFERNREFEKSRDLYNIIIRVPEKYSLKDQVKAYDRIWRSYKNQRDRETSIIHLSSMTKWLQEKINLSNVDQQKFLYYHFIDRSILLARAHWTQGRLKKGKGILENVLKSSYANSTQQAQAHWIIGKMFEEQKRYFLSIKKYQEASQLIIHNRKLSKNVYWSLSWSLIQNNQLSKAIESLKTISKKNDIETDKYLFWLADCYHKKRNLNQAEKIWNQISEEYPRSYYGILSHIKLNKIFHPISKKEFENQSEEKILEWLLAHDEPTYARSYLKNLKDKKVDLKPFLHYLEKSGWYNQSLKMYYTIPKNQRDQNFEQYISLQYPMAYTSIIVEKSKQYNIEPSLILAISRQESLFDTNARSPSDAYGIMQLIPKQAKKISYEHNLVYEDPRDLFSPHLNISLGAILLNKLKAQYQNQFPLFVASYNASSAAVKSWYKTRFNGSFLEFIEKIPYKETKNYIKQVLKNYVIYRQRLTKKPFFLKKDFRFVNQ